MCFIKLVMPSLRQEITRRGSDPRGRGYRARNYRGNLSCM